VYSVTIPVLSVVVVVVVVLVSPLDVCP